MSKILAVYVMVMPCSFANGNALFLRLRNNDTSPTVFQVYICEYFSRNEDEYGRISLKSVNLRKIFRTTNYGVVI